MYNVSYHFKKKIQKYLMQENRRTVKNMKKLVRSNVAGWSGKKWQKYYKIKKFIKGE